MFRCLLRFRGENWGKLLIRYSGRKQPQGKLKILCILLELFRYRRLNKLLSIHRKLKELIVQWMYERIHKNLLWDQILKEEIWKLMWIVLINLMKVWEKLIEEKWKLSNNKILSQNMMLTQLSIDFSDQTNSFLKNWKIIIRQF